MTSPPKRPAGRSPEGKPRRRKRRDDTQVGPPPPSNPGAPEPAGPPIPLDPVLIAGHWYERRNLSGREYVLIPAVAASSQDTDPIPEKLVRFAGYPTTMQVMIRQENRFLFTPAPPDQDGPPPGFVAGLTQWSISLDGDLVYCPATPARTALLALVDAQNAIQRLLLHPVRWQDPLDWQDRACYYQGTPCRVTRYSPQLGEVLLTAEPGHTFPPSWVDLEADTVPTDPITEVVADILYSPIWWDRERDYSGYSPGTPAPTPGTRPGTRPGTPAPAPTEAEAESHE